MQMPGNITSWPELVTIVRISGLLRYLDRLYAQVGNMADDFKDWMEFEFQKIEDVEARAKFLVKQEAAHREHTEYYPRLFLNSFHIVAYALLETELHSIARQIGKKQKQKFDASEIRGGNYLESAVHYIKKLTGIDAKAFSRWGDLIDGQKLRNIIVHSNGKVTKESDAKLARRWGVYDASKKEVTITHDYCKSFIELLKTFFSEIHKQTQVGNFV